MRNSLAILLALAGPAGAETVIQPCGSVVQTDPANYCHQRIAHRPDMAHATAEARQYAIDQCILAQQRLGAWR